MVGRYRKYPVASITGFVTNPTNDYKALIKALVIHGPQARWEDASDQRSGEVLGSTLHINWLFAVCRLLTSSVFVASAWDSYL